jgi:hypothetical protein
VTLHDYQASQQLGERDWPFYGLIMAAMRRADTVNAERLRRAFPTTYKEMRERYDAPRGLLRGERDRDFRRREDGELEEL